MGNSTGILRRMLGEYQGDVLRVNTRKILVGMLEAEQESIKGILRQQREGMIGTTREFLSECYG